MMGRYFKKCSKAIPLQRQKTEILKYNKDWTVEISKGGNKLIARGFISPDIDSFNILVEIIYRKGFKPKITLPHHVFKRDSKGNLPPHIYDDHSLCVHYPKNYEWTPMKLLSDTIIPWTMNWLFHYETWCKSEKWHGGGTIRDKNQVVMAIESPPLFV